MAEETIPAITKKTAVNFLAGKLLPIALSAILPVGSYLYLKGAAITSDPRYVQISLVAIAILLFISIILFIYSARMYIRYGKFCEAYGVLWDRQFNIRCMSCHRQLKHSSTGAETFYCSSPKCNNKHILRDNNGSKLTKQQAINLLKGDCEQAGSVGPR